MVIRILLTIYLTIDVKKILRNSIFFNLIC